MPGFFGGAQISSPSQLGDDTVLSSKIKDGEIVNADIKATAAIALSKLATDPLARANHTGTQTASTISDFAAAVQALISQGVGEQEIPYVVGTTAAIATTLKVATNTAGNILIFGYVNGANMYFAKAVKAGSNWYISKITGATTFGFGADTMPGICIAGSYVYVSYILSGEPRIGRLNLSDLTGATGMSISGTSRGGAMFSDDTSIYINYADATITKYTISGTTATNAGDTAFTSETQALGNIACDGVNMWTIDKNTTSGAINLDKYPITGGARTSRTVIYIYPNGYPNSGSMNVLYFASGILQVAWGITIESNSAVVSEALKIISITAP